MPRGGIQAGKAFVEFFLSDKKLNSQLQRIGQKMRNFGAIGLAATTPILAAFGAAANAFANAGDEIGKMSKRTGVGAEALSELGFAARRSGTDLPTVEKGLKRMSTTVLDAAMGLSTAVDSMDLLGVDLKELGRLKPEDQFQLLAEKLGALEDPTLKAALAQKIFGRAGTALLPLFSEGEKGMAALRNQARSLGLTLSNEDAAAAEKLRDALDSAKEQVYAMAVQVGAAIAGPLMNFLRWSSVVLGNIIAWIKANPRLVAGIAAITVGIAAASAAAVVFGTILAIISAHPIIAALTLIAGLVLGVATYFGLASSAASDFKGSLDGVDMPGASSNAGLSSQANRAQSQLQGALSGRTTQPVAASAATASAPAKDYGAEIAKWTKESAESLASIAKVLKVENTGLWAWL